MLCFFFFCPIFLGCFFTFIFFFVCVWLLFFFFIFAVGLVFFFFARAVFGCVCFILVAFLSESGPRVSIAFVFWDVGVFFFLLFFWFVS